MEQVMHNKHRILISLTTLVLGAAAATAQAGDRGRGNAYGHDRERDRGYAEVLHVEPVFERVRYTVPVEQCWDEERIVRKGADRHVIVGALIGAAIGKHVGQVNGLRGASTLGGAVIGAAVGNEISRDRGEYRDGRREVVRRCETRQEERWDRQVVAYQVDYVYRGRRDVTRLAYDPGRWVRLDDARRYG
jgi:uncharacterized protein YcfJ